MTFIAAGLGMFMMVTRNGDSMVIFFCISLLLLFAFRIVGSVRLRDTIVGLKQKYAITHQVQEEIRSFEDAELYFRRAATFSQWWHTVCFAADKLDFARGLLPLTQRDGTKRMLVWEKDDKDIRADEIVKMIVPVRDRRVGSALNLEVQIHANGSLESAGRRLTLLGRLLEEYSIANLTG